MVQCFGMATTFERPRAPGGAPSRGGDAPGIRHRLEEMLRRFGIPALRPGQARAFEAVASGRDVLVILPTAGGKSLCYQLPAACGLAPAIVVSPLVALMKDQVESLARRGIPAAQLSGAVSARERDEAWGALDEGRLTLLYVAPEALASSRTLARLARAAPRLLAVDEAHCISEWGESFRPSYLSLGAVRTALGNPPAVALTATATPRTARDIVTRLALHDPETIRGGFDRRNLRLHVTPVPGESGRLTRLLALATQAPGPAVCYASRRRDTERLAATFRRHGVCAAPFHAGLSPAERGRRQDDFQANRLSMIVATSAFGMGVDKPDVRLVVHAAPPLTLEAYYQEAGRGGRDGGPADCVLLLAPNDVARARSRLSADAVTPGVLRALLALLAGAAAGLADARDARGATARLAHALGCSPQLVGTSLRLLTEAGLIGPAEGDGALRLLATPGRLARLALDAGRDPAAAGAARALLALVGDTEGGPPGLASAGHAGAAAPVPRTFDRAALRRAAPDGDVPAFVRQLESLQLAAWCPHGAPWRALRAGDEATLGELARRHRTRAARDRWRFDQVVRMLITPRCRRLVLLRYFGDPSPTHPCGACDRCGFAP